MLMPFNGIRLRILNFKVSNASLIVYVIDFIYFRKKEKRVLRIQSNSVDTFEHSGLQNKWNLNGSIYM